MNVDSLLKEIVDLLISFQDKDHAAVCVWCKHRKVSFSADMGKLERLHRDVVLPVGIRVVSLLPKG